MDAPTPAPFDLDAAWEAPHAALSLALEQTQRLAEALNSAGQGFTPEPLRSEYAEAALHLYAALALFDGGALDVAHVGTELVKAAEVPV